MVDVTVSIDEATLIAAQAYAKEQGWSIDELVGRLVKMAVAPIVFDQLRATFARADEMQCRSGGPWSRDDLYDEPL